MLEAVRADRAPRPRPCTPARRCRPRCGADQAFSDQVEEFLQAVRRYMSVPTDVDDPVVDREFQALRAELERERADFRGRHAQLLAAQLAPERVARLARSLQVGAQQGCSRDLARLERGTRELLQMLRVRMATIPLYGLNEPAA